MSDILWEPSKGRIDSCTLTAFMRATEQRWKRSFPDYEALYEFSVAEIDKFWMSVAAFCDVRAEEWGERAVVDAHKMPGARFFPDARLNYAENLLRRRDDGPAIVFRAEDKVRRTMSWRDLTDTVARLAQALKDDGRETRRPLRRFRAQHARDHRRHAGDHGGGRGLDLVLARFRPPGRAGPVRPDGPKVLFTADGYFYNGKSHDSLARVADFLTDLPTVEQVVVLPLVVRRAGRVAGAECPHPGRRDRRSCRPARCRSSICRSTTRFTSCIPRARRAFPNASCTAPAARCCST